MEFIHVHKDCVFLYNTSGGGDDSRKGNRRLPKDSKLESYAGIIVFMQELLNLMQEFIHVHKYCVFLFSTSGGGGGDDCR